MSQEKEALFDIYLVNELKSSLILPFISYFDTPPPIRGETPKLKRKTRGVLSPEAIRYRFY